VGHTVLGSTVAAIVEPDPGFDSTHGYGLADLLGVGPPPEPAGFDGFWAALKARADGVDVAPTVLASSSEVAGPSGLRWTVLDVAFTSLGGVRIGGWLVVPADGRTDAGLVVSHGYGGREEPDVSLIPPRTAAIFPCSRGLPTRSLQPGVPSEGSAHVLVGIDDPLTYIHGGCAADIWCAATALAELVPGAGRRLAYWGGSFGGGIGPMALQVDPRFTRAVLEVPSFGHHPLRLELPCTGSGAAVRAYAAEYPDVVRTLSFFDAATCATRVDMRTVVAPALADPAVPPPGQFAVANALAGDTTVVAVSAGHAEYPAEADELVRFRALAASLLDPDS
jgi:cephalosporin-C deacetylase